MSEKTEDILDTLLGILFIIFGIIIGIIIYNVCEMLNDHRCYNLPLNEFYQDESCSKYWNFKKWENEGR